MISGSTFICFSQSRYWNLAFSSDKKTQKHEEREEGVRDAITLESSAVVWHLQFCARIQIWTTHLARHTDTSVTPVLLLYAFQLLLTLRFGPWPKFSSLMNHAYATTRLQQIYAVQQNESNLNGKQKRDTSKLNIKEWDITSGLTEWRFSLKHKSTERHCEWLPI